MASGRSAVKSSSQSSSSGTRLGVGLASCRRKQSHTHMSHRLRCHRTISPYEGPGLEMQVLGCAPELCHRRLGCQVPWLRTNDVRAKTRGAVVTSNALESTVNSLRGQLLFWRRRFHVDEVTCTAIHHLLEVWEDMGYHVVRLFRAVTASTPCRTTVCHLFVHVLI